MGVRERIALLVEAQGASKAKRDIDSVGKATGNLGAKTKTSGKNMGVARGAASALGSSIRGMARWAKYGALAVGGLALVLGKRSIDEWREAGRVNRVTAARIKSTGQAAGLTADQVGDMSTSLSNLLGIDDEEIQNVANRLLTFTSIKKNTFQPALQAAVDMGAEMGNTQSAATMLGKALQDPVKGATALRRAGVNLSEQQQEQLTQWVEQGDTLKAQRWILKELNTEFGGTAKAQTDGLKRMSTSWKNVEESIGGVFGPGLDFAGNKFADFADKKMIPAIDSIAAEMRGIWDPNSDDDLQQRLDRSGNLLTTRLAPVWSRVKNDIDRANIDDKLLEIFSAAVPRIAETMGKGGGRALIAFTKGWLKSPWWAKLFTFAFLAGKLGGFSALASLAAKRFMLRFAPQLAAAMGIEMAATGRIGNAVAGSGRWTSLGGRAGRFFMAGFITLGLFELAMHREEIQKKLKDTFDIGSGDVGPADVPGSTPDTAGKPWWEPFVGGIPGFASGGRADRGGLAVVGEEGPEVVRLPQGAEVTPNEKAASAGRSLGDRPVNITSVLYLTEGGKEEIARGVRQVSLRDLLAESPA